MALLPVALEEPESLQARDYVDAPHSILTLPASCPRLKNRLRKSPREHCCSVPDPRPPLMLAKQAWRRYLKREPRFLRIQKPGLARRDSRPSYTATCASCFWTPYQFAPDTGSTAIWLRKPAAGRVSARRAWSKADAAWLIPPLPALPGSLRRADA